MAWDGIVKREIRSIRYGDYFSTVGLECGHEIQTLGRLQLSAFRREIVCPDCSAEPRERIVKIRNSIRFDDVIAKMRK